MELLRYVDCRSLCAFRRSSTAASALGLHSTHTTASHASYLSSSPSLLQAFDDIVPLALSRMASPPSLVFLFLSPNYPPSTLPAAFTHLTSLLPPSTRLFGCHGIGILGRDHLTLQPRELERQERGVSMSLLHLPGVAIDARFVDLNTIQRGLGSGPKAPPPWMRARGAVTGGDGGEWLREALGLKKEGEEGGEGAAPSFILLSSPVTVVSSFLQALHSLAPHSSITGAVASGGRQATIGLFTKNTEREVVTHYMGIAVLTLTPISPPSPPSPHSSSSSIPFPHPPPTTSSSLSPSPSPHPSPFPPAFSLFPPLTGFASRGCKPCSGVYQITASLNDVVNEVREVQAFPTPDEAEDPLLHPAVLDRLVGQAPPSSPSSVPRDEAVLEDLLQREQQAERRVGQRVADSPSVEVWDVLREVMQRSQGLDGYINGLFIGLSDECESQQGRVLCDVIELQKHGIKVDTESFRAISSELTPFTSTNTTPSSSSSSSSSSSVPAAPSPSLSLQGKYVQFFELDPSACMLDLANRIRPIARATPLTSTSHPPPSSTPLLPPPIPPAPLLSSLLFTCSGRGSAFFNRPNIDTAICAHQSGLDVCGFFCNGEIGPPARSLQGQSWMKREEEEQRRRTAREGMGGGGGGRGDAGEGDSGGGEAGMSGGGRGVLGGTGERERGREKERVGGGVSVEDVDGRQRFLSEPAVLQSFTAVVTLFNSQWV